MIVQDLSVAEIRPYERNPRKNAKAVKAVAESIREFGFRVPLVIDRNKGNEVVCGHTRLLAAKELGLETVPCTFADGLSPKQIKAFRLADNKTAELADWDKELLAIELEDLVSFDGDADSNDGDKKSDWLPNLTGLGFDSKDLFPEPPDCNIERTINIQGLWSFDPNRADGFYQIPTIKPCQVIPESMIDFNAAYGLKKAEPTAAVHFYIDDYRFERLWPDPRPYFEKLSGFAAVLTPDFSLYLDTPIAIMIWNIYRSCMVGQLMQDAGLNVIPTLHWSRELTFDFCFAGLPKHSVLSVSTMSIKKDEFLLNVWRAGMDEAIKRLDPSCLLVYGGPIDYDFPCPVRHYKNLNIERVKNIKK